MAVVGLCEFSSFGGGCLCKAVKYTIIKAPIASLICLCSQCQTIAGGFGVGSVIVPKDGVIIVAGDDNLVDFIVPGSTTQVVRRFCKTCGTHMFASNAAHPVTAVHAGTLAESDHFNPQVVIWCQSKRPYHRFSDGLPQFEQYPPSPK